jgi:hypothetical protein
MFVNDMFNIKMFIGVQYHENGDFIFVSDDLIIRDEQINEEITLFPQNT